MTMLQSRPLLSVEQLTIKRQAGRTLLRDASFDLKAGEILLLVGGIGTGKSTLLRVLSGLLSGSRSGWEISGRVVTQQQSADLARESIRAGAMVFQGSALFDDLSITDNLDIAATHAEAPSGAAAAFAAALVASVRGDGPTSQASGGERQLIAIARTVLSNQSMLLFDEPNSGLDPEKTIRLAAVLEAIKQDIGCSMVITAHHILHLLPIADRVIFLDPETGGLVPLPADVAAIEQRLCVPDAQGGRAPPATGAQARSQLARPPSRLFWQWLFFRRYVWSLCFSPEALLYMGLGGVLIGFIPTWFTFARFPQSGYLTPLFHEELLAGIGFAQFRVLVPLVTAILLAARSSAIIAADLGHRVYSSQLDAMQNLRIPRHAYLSGNIIASCLVAAMAGLAFTFAISASISLATWGWMFPDMSNAFWREHFFALLQRGSTSVPPGSAWVLAKSAVCAAAISIASIALGLAAKRSIIELNRAIAVAVVTTLALVLCIHTVAAMLEF